MNILELPNEIIKEIFIRMNSVCSIPFLLSCHHLKNICCDLLSYEYHKKDFRKLIVSIEDQEINKSSRFYGSIPSHCYDNLNLLKWYRDNNFPINYNKLLLMAIEKNCHETIEWLQVLEFNFTKESLRKAIIYKNHSLVIKLINQGINDKNLVNLLIKYSTIDIIEVYLQLYPLSLSDNILLNFGDYGEYDNLLFIHDYINNNYDSGKGDNFPRKHRLFIHDYINNNYDNGKGDNSPRKHRLLKRIKESMARACLYNNDLITLKELNVLPNSIPYKCYNSITIDIIEYLLAIRFIFSYGDCCYFLRYYRLDILNYVYLKLGQNIFLGTGKNLSLENSVRNLESIQWLHDRQLIRNIKELYKYYAITGKDDVLNWLHKNNYHCDEIVGGNPRYLNWFVKIYGKDKINGEDIILWSLRCNNIHIVLLYF